MATKTMTTLHISDAVKASFKKLTVARKRDMSDVVEELMKRWMDEQASPRTDRMQMDHAVSLLTKAVSEQLVRNPQWARDALIGAGLGLPGSNVFANRFMHFLDEKQELGKRLARWILERSLWHIENGRRTFLVCDSGTTVFWFMKAFAEAIGERFHASDGKLLAQLCMVTNNVPGAEAFVTYASLHSIMAGEHKKRISDLVDCRILAGTFLPEYAAITGDDTERDLESIAAQARAGKAGKHSGPVFMAITTGNWITIRSRDSATLPCFFARGRGHGGFKKKLLEICEEGFALAPLGKLLVDTAVDELNKRLHFSETAANASERSYDAIWTPAKKAKAMKVVSSIRQKQSILRDHSALLCRKLGAFAVLDMTELKSASQARRPITEVQHLLFPFDQLADENFETQMEIELPHVATREAEFRREVFNIHEA